jgi:hypothetical protein
MGMKLQRIFLAVLMLSSVSAAFGQSVEEFEKQHFASVATPEGKAYESLVSAEFLSDLGFMPKCAGRVGVNSGAVTIYYEINTEGEVSNVYMTPDSVLATCIHPLIMSREFTPPADKWLGKITLTISQ